MGNTFLEKLYTQCDGVTSPRPFSKKSKLCISLDQQLENLDSLILLNAQVEDYQNSFYKKGKICQEQAAFSARFSKERIRHVIFY